MIRFFMFVMLSFSLVFSSELENDNSVIVGKLENGLTYYIKQNKTPQNSALIYLNVAAGSINEKENEQGLAHFVEHMVFNGTKDFDKNSLISELEKLGVKFGADLNAATSFDNTFYKLEINSSKQNLQSGFKVLENMAHYALFNEDELQKEKGIIIEEDRMRKDSSERIFKQSMPYIYKDSIYLNRLPIGKMDIVKSATPEIMREFYTRNYQPKLMSLIVVGDFDVDEVKKLISENFSDIKNTKEIPNVDKSISFWDKFVVFNSHDSEVTNESIRVYFEGKANVIKDKNSYKEYIIKRYFTKLFSQMSSNLAQKGLITNDIYFYDYNLFDQKSLNVFTQRVVSNDYIGGVKNIFSLINKVKKDGFDKSYFEAAKSDFLSLNEMKFKKSQTQSSKEYLMDILNFVQNGDIFLSPKDDYEITKELLNDITLDEINAKFKGMVEKNGVMVEFLTKDKFNFDEKNIKAIREIKPIKVDFSVNLPNSLDVGELKSVKFVDKKIDKSGVIKYSFENGINVYYKPNEKQKNKMTYIFSSKGGFSNLESVKFPAMSVDISNGSGVGKYSDFEINVITKGQMFSLNKFINETSRGYKGESSKDDFENMLKMLVLDIKSPKLSDEFAKRFKIKSLDALNKNSSNPMYNFLKKYNQKYYNNNEKKSFLNADDINKFDINKGREFIKFNYSNPYNFNLIVSGDMSESKFEELINKCIGSMDTKTSITNIKDDGIRAVKNGFFEDFSSNDERSLVQIKFTNNDIKFSPQKDIIFDAASSILSNILRENIRQKDSEVYSISAAYDLNKLPYARSIGIINYSSSPNNAKLIVEKSKDIIKKYQKEFVDEVYLQNYKKSAIISLQKNMDKSSFLINHINQAVINDEQILSYDDMAKIINSVTLQDIKTALNELFDTNKMFVGIFSPKK